MTRLIKFDSVEERNKWMDNFFPDRKVTQTPGLYKVKDGSIGVFLKSVWVYGKAQNRIKEQGNEVE